GLPIQRSLLKRAWINFKVYTFKALKRLIPITGMDINDLRSKFGSVDYKNVGELREIFVKVINEDLSSVAHKIICPTLLIYGGKDTETPPEIGERLAALILDARLSVLSEQDHYSVIGEGRHQVVRRIHDFLTPCN
ncbi:MAG: alpha/beta hydrolase, partial [Hyphomicrobiaceae bacterium]|nr:alpha/beta hydrolase [Hyphomicrobiaceae bacterium]